MPTIVDIAQRAAELIRDASFQADHPASNVPFKIASGDAPLEMMPKRGELESTREFQVRPMVRQEIGSALGRDMLRLLQTIQVVVRYGGGKREDRFIRLKQWAAADAAHIHSVLRQKPVAGKWGASASILRDMRLVDYTEITESDVVDESYYFSLTFAPLYDLEVTP